MGMLSGLADSLLNVYDAVLFADADEFVVADPDEVREHPAPRRRPGGPRRARRGRPQRRARAVRGAARPGRADARAAPLRQVPPAHVQAAIKRVPAAWRWASHGIMAPYAVDPDLFMFHMKYGDRDQLRAISGPATRRGRRTSRADGTSWTLDADESVEVLDRLWDDVDLDRGEAVRGPPGPAARRSSRSGRTDPGGPWVRDRCSAMRKRPLVAVPERFRGLV